MPTIEPRAIPDDYYSFSLKDLSTLVTALKRLIERQEVMHRKEAANFIGIHVRTLDRLANDGGIPSHRLPGLEGTRLYLRSEMIDYIKRH